jgi:Galactose oxidase, central domain/Kelch motif
MTNQRELDRLLGAYFVEGTDELADRVVDAALDQIDHTPQRRAWRIPWSFPTMNLSTRLAAVAVIGVIAIGGALILVQRNEPSVAGPLPTTTREPTATQTARPGPTITPAEPTSLTGPLGTGRQIHTATLLKDGRVLIVGGYALGDGPLASAVLYDPSTNTFSPTGSLAEARGYHTATLLADGRVLITGGGSAGWPGSITGITGPFLASAELYDPKTGTFSPTGSMATPREVHTATLLADGRVLITGGADYQAHAVASAELYDPKTGKFSPTGSMTTARAFHTATLLADGRVLVGGGSPAAWGTTVHLASAEIYDPKTGTFTATGSMITERDFDTATLLADGRVLVAGGSGLTQEDLASAEIYDPKTRTFTATGSMTDGREYQTATLLADGRVLVVGGGSDYTTRMFLASAEVYDPTTGTFIATGSLATARTYQAATMLADGRVLLTGGYGAVAPLASAEIYDPVSGTFSPAG